MNPDELQKTIDAPCKCGHARRWHGELVHSGEGVTGITNGTCNGDSPYSAHVCTCVVFRPADLTECPCCKGTGKVKK